MSLGLSDGIWVEVKSGVDATSRIKKQDPGTDTAKSGAPGAAKPARR